MKNISKTLYAPEHMTTPHEPDELALRQAAIKLAELRDQVAVQLRAAEAEEVRARVQLRFPAYADGLSPGALRGVIARLEHTVEWLDYRADMRGAW